MEILDSDNIKLSVLNLKQLGDIMTKVKFHLDAALIEYNYAQKKCQQIENESGVKMRFMTE